LPILANVLVSDPPGQVTRDETVARRFLPPGRPEDAGFSVKKTHLPAHPKALEAASDPTLCFSRARGWATRIKPTDTSV